jgi:hypothetical protein
MDDRHFGSNRKFLERRAGDQVWIGPGWQAHNLRRRSSVLHMVDFTPGELIWSGTSNWTNTHNLHTIISYRFVCRICTWESSSMCYIISCKNRYTSEAVTLDVPTAHGCKCSQYKRTVVVFFLLFALCPNVPYLVIAFWGPGVKVCFCQKKKQFPPTD